MTEMISTLMPLPWIKEMSGIVRDCLARNDFLALSEALIKDVLMLSQMVSPIKGFSERGGIAGMRFSITTT